MQAYTRPPQTLRRVVGTHEADWIRAIKEGLKGAPPARRSSTGGALTEMVLLGVLAIRMKDQRLEWDSKNLRFTNNEAANALLKIHTARGGRCSPSTGRSAQQDCERPDVGLVADPGRQAHHTQSGRVGPRGASPRATPADPARRTVRSSVVSTHGSRLPVPGRMEATPSTRRRAGRATATSGTVTRLTVPTSRTVGCSARARRRSDPPAPERRIAAQ